MAAHAPVTRCEVRPESVKLPAHLPLLLQLLTKCGRMIDRQVLTVLQAQKERNLTLEVAVPECGIADAEEVARLYADHFCLPLADFPAAPLELKRPAKDAKAGDTEANPVHPMADALPAIFCWEKKVVPLTKEDGLLYVAMADPGDADAVNQIRLYTGLQVNVAVATQERVEEQLSLIFGERDLLMEIVQEAKGEDEDAGEAEGATNVLDLTAVNANGLDGQVVRMVNQIMLGAYRERASDIHIEPSEQKVAIRFRIDGQLHEQTPVPRNLVIPLISRLKVIAKLDIAEKRLPQDGAFTVKVDGSEFDVRVSTVPVVWGEKIVMRLLNKGAVQMVFESLGFNAKQREDFIAGISHHNGLVFVTGPTGSGKSTTLYTALTYLNDITSNIMTAEDPVEYKFPGINQVHIRHNIGLTFASALRAFLRQDPDIIMVGEVRDQETAEICMRAALTGHLVLSTLHTNSALDAISRLKDMGVPPFLIAATLRCVEAQRLVRKLCKHCKRPFEAEEHIRRLFGFPDNTVLHQAVGCDECRGSGYRGRVGLYEVVPAYAELSSAIGSGGTYDEMAVICAKHQNQMLRDSAIEKVLKGDTSVEEVWQFAAAHGA